MRFALVTATRFLRARSLVSSLLAPLLLICASLLALPANAAGYYTQAGKIYDATGQEIQVRGISHYGFNALILQPQFLWAMGWKEQIAQIKSLGFNAVRVPFVPDTLYTTATVETLSYVDPGKNPELIGKTPLQVLDLWMAEADRQGLYIMLDFHSVSMQRQYPTWFVDNPADFNLIYNKQAYTVSNWTRDLAFVAQRYASLSHFMAIDIYNEPNGIVRWSAGDVNAADPKYHWKTGAETGASAVLQANPNLLIFVQGINGNYDSIENTNVAMNWGEDFQPQRYQPLNIPSNKLVLSPHTYGPDVYQKSSFSASNFPNNLAGDWDILFGQFFSTTAVVIGEWGGHYGNGTGGAQDITWQNALVDYLVSKNVRNSFYWCYTPNSFDTGGILDDNLNVRTDKMSLLQRLWGSTTTPTPAPTPSAVASLSATTYSVAQNAGSISITVNRTVSFANAMSVALVSSNGSAVSGIDFTQVNTTLNWAANDSAAKTFNIAISNAVPFQGSKSFTLAITNPSSGATLGGTTTATVTINGSAAITTSTSKLAFASATLSVPQTAGFATVNVARTGSTSSSVSVTYQTSNGTAVAGSDYTAKSGKLSWNVGDGNTKSFLVPVSNVAAFAGTKSFNVSLSKPLGGATTTAPTVASVTIQGTASNATPQQSIASFSPMSGPTGTVVTVTGSGFTNSNQAWVGNGHDAGIRVISDTKVEITVPASATTGAIGIFNTAHAAFTPSAFTVTTTAPVIVQQYISSFSPASGPAGTIVTVVGSGFTNSNQAWVGNAHDAGIRVVDDAHVQVTIPSDATTGAIGIFNATYAAFTPMAFTVTSTTTAPTTTQQYISSFAPTSGAVGTVVTVVGSGFTSSNQAWVGNAHDAGIYVVDDAHVQVTVPNDATTGAIGIFNAQYATFTPISFTVTP